ncbi:MAG: succinate dehydrogenase flavoprotein subunit [Acidobacteria bacterium]|nr:succinate dehydrogenase flavoprotein subunit [Acidobacteriota bacterium]
MNKRHIAVVGGGLAGLMATIKIAEQGIGVNLFSILNTKRSASVSAQNGINAAINLKGKSDSPEKHFQDTLYEGDYLADQKAVKAMCEMAPSIIYILDRMGVAFNRTKEGLINTRLSSGSLFHRSAYCGTTTGQQILYALDEQVRCYESKGLVQKYEGWEFLSLVLDNQGISRGLVAMHLNSLELKVFVVDAVIIASGGIGSVFGKSTNSIISTGSAQSIAYQQGAEYANAEFIQVHPTTLWGEDKLRLISEAVRSEGGRVWVPRAREDKRLATDIPDKERWYFLEEKYPKYGNLISSDIASREILQICLDGYGVDGKNQVYLDLPNKSEVELNRRLKATIELYETFTKEDPRKTPMKVFPGVHYTMGGLYVDVNQKTSIDGVYAAGECDFSIHGANRLGANSLISCIYGAIVAAISSVNYLKGLEKHLDVLEPMFEIKRREQEEINDTLAKQTGSENAHLLYEEMGSYMTENVTVIRENKKLEDTNNKLQELQQRIKQVDLNESNFWANQALPHLRNLHNMLELARVITLCALARNESRGAHYKKDFPERDDENWLKTSIASYSLDVPKISYREVDTSLITPKPRKYS